MNELSISTGAKPNQDKLTEDSNGFLAELKGWFTKNNLVFQRDELFEEFFLDGSLKPGIHLNNSLCANNYSELKLWLSILIGYPEMVTINAPEIIEALGIIMRSPRSPHAKNAPTESNIKPTLASASRPATRPRQKRRPVATMQAITISYPTLPAAIAGELGKTAAEIARRWSKSHKTPLSELDKLSRDPEKTLLQNPELLAAVHQVLSPVLPTSAYPTSLQEQIKKLAS